MAKITKTFVDKVQPPASGYAVHWDDSVKGYGLRVSSQGKRVFIAMGRVLGKPIQFTLGPYGVLTEDKARAKAQRVLQDMREGIDPRDSKRADEAMKVTLQEVCDAYVERPGKLKESSKAEMKRHVEKVFASWKDKPIVAITEDDVRKRHREMVEKGLDGKRGAPASANASMVTLRILINFASRQYRRADGSPLVQRNPVEVLKDHWAKLGSRTERYIDRRKVGEVWNALLTIPYGETRSYENIARQIGRPNAQRAVGKANGDNRIAILIPCHRVIEKGGALRGYAGGLWRKQRLLEIEQG